MKILLFGACTILLLIGQSATACSCVNRPLKTMLEEAEGVFTGQVTNIKKFDDKSGEPRIIVTIHVFRVWKGDIPETMVMHTIYNQISCAGYAFRENQRVLVFARRVQAKGWLAGVPARQAKDIRGHIFTVPATRLPLSGPGLPGPEDFIFSTNVCSGTRAGGAGPDLEAIVPSTVPSAPGK
jgi:hypothetical protein